MDFYEKTFLHNDLYHDIHKRVLTTHDRPLYGITPVPIILPLGMLIAFLKKQRRSEVSTQMLQE